MESSELLRTIPLFADVLDGPQIDALGAKSRFLVFPEGSLLMVQGDFGASMFVIAAGEVSVRYENERGGEAMVATLGPGKIVGEMSLMTGARRTATVTAVAQVTALEIPKAALESVLARSPDLVDSFGTILAVRQVGLERAAEDARRAHHLTPPEIVRQIRRFFSDIFGGSEGAGG